jgi:hypothetical protein
MEASVERHEKLRSDQVVWAKVFGFPWWPAYVQSLLSQVLEVIDDKREVLVIFINDFSQ